MRKVIYSLTIVAVALFAVPAVFAQTAAAARSSSWRWPFDETALPLSMLRAPSRSVNRPPASSTMTGYGVLRVEMPIAQLHAPCGPRP